MASKFAWLVCNRSALLAVATLDGALAGMLGGGVDHSVSKECMGFWEGPG